MISIPNRYNLLLHQIEHYSQLAKDAKTFELRVKYRNDVYNFRQQLKTYLN